jgi:predicted heme/steroid binding protein
MASPAMRQWTKEEVASHKTVNDCWLILSGRVYDVTEFLSRHPAGGRIIQMHGGRDCTSAFLDVHAESYLTQFLPASAFKGVLAGSGVTAAPKAKFVGKYWQPEEVLSVPRTTSSSLYTPEMEEYRKRLRAFVREHVHPVYDKSVDAAHSQIRSSLRLWPAALQCFLLVSLTFLIFIAVRTFSARWEQQGHPDMSVLRQMASEGFYFRNSIPAEYGGLGVADWRYNALTTEELEHLGVGKSLAQPRLGRHVALLHQVRHVGATEVLAHEDREGEQHPGHCNERTGGQPKHKAIGNRISRHQADSWLGDALRPSPCNSALVFLCACCTDGFRSGDSGHACSAQRRWGELRADRLKNVVSAGSTADIVVISAVPDPCKGARSSRCSRWREASPASRLPSA